MAPDRPAPPSWPDSSLGAIAALVLGAALAALLLALVLL